MRLPKPVRRSRDQGNPHLDWTIAFARESGQANRVPHLPIAWTMHGPGTEGGEHDAR